MPSAKFISVEPLRVMEILRSSQKVFPTNSVGQNEGQNISDNMFEAGSSFERALDKIRKDQYKCDEEDELIERCSEYAEIKIIRKIIVLFAVSVALMWLLVTRGSNEKSRGKKNRELSFVRDRFRRRGEDANQTLAVGKYFVFGKREESGTFGIGTRARVGLRLIFWSVNWLSLLDVTLGWIFGIFILKHSGNVLETYKFLYQYVSSPLLLLRVNWLRERPAGLKLNPQLNHFIAEIIKTVLTAW